MISVGLIEFQKKNALNIDQKYLPKQQKLSPMDNERKKALKEEVDRLVDDVFCQRRNANLLKGMKFDV